MTHRSCCGLLAVLVAFGLAGLGCGGRSSSPTLENDPEKLQKEAQKIQKQNEAMFKKKT
jgi:hypothetical protein